MIGALPMACFSLPEIVLRMVSRDAAGNEVRFSIQNHAPKAYACVHRV